MNQVNGITVCVDYDDLLAITLPKNALFLRRVLVVTHPRDERTKAVVRSVPNAQVYETDAFYRHGAKFNKGLAMEEGFDVLGRSGWMLIFDADTLFPDCTWFPPHMDPTYLYTANRIHVRNVQRFDPRTAWRDAIRIPDSIEAAGYFQLFHADDPHIMKRPWYDMTFAHAGGADGYFQSRWPRAAIARMPFDVLHLGPRDANWFGRVSPRVDDTPVDDEQVVEQRREDMRKYMTEKGWLGMGVGKKDKVDEHVDVPGATPQGFDP